MYIRFFFIKTFRSKASLPMAVLRLAELRDTAPGRATAAYALVGTRNDLLPAPKVAPG